MNVRVALALLLAVPVAARARPTATLSYGASPEQRVDLYACPHSRSLVLWVHGGGWHSGDKNEISPTLVSALRRRGVEVAAPNFRQVPHVRVPAMLADLKGALAAVRKRRPHSRIALMGGSSGGYLAAMLGLSDPKIAAVVDKCGPADLTLKARSWVQILTVRTAFAGLPLREWSPVYCVHAGAPPFLLFHGTADDLVPVEQSRALLKALRIHGVPCELVEVHHAGHEFGPAGGRPSLSSAQIEARIVRFLTAATTYSPTRSVAEGQRHARKL